MTETEKIKINTLLDAVIAGGMDKAISWLRGAYLTHEEQKAKLLADLNELRALYLANNNRPLSVREGQLLGVCRICRKRHSAEPGNAFIMNFGEEFSHQKCLDNWSW